MNGELFCNLPASTSPRPLGAEPRPVREPLREQIELRPLDLEALIGPEHSARAIWDYVRKLELAQLELAVLAQGPAADRMPASPRLLLALWLYATAQGIGSARVLARLCDTDNAYRWLSGGVSVDETELDAFDRAHSGSSGQFLTQHLAALASAGLIALEMRVPELAYLSDRPPARRHRGSLGFEIDKACRLVEALRHEAERDPDASSSRLRAKAAHAAREREDKVAAALRQLRKINAVLASAQASRLRTGERRGKRHAGISPM